MTDFCTLSDVKSMFNIKDTDTARDAEISRLITAVTQEIKTACKLEIESKEYTEYYSGNGTDTLMVDNYPITAITSIHDDIDYVFGDDTLFSATEDYHFQANSKNAKAGIIKLDGNVFGKGDDNIKIVYTAGYSTVPKDVVQACVLKVGAELMLNKYIFNGPILDGTGAEIKDPGRMRKRSEDLLKPYRKIV